MTRSHLLGSWFVIMGIIPLIPQLRHHKSPLSTTEPQDIGRILDGLDAEPLLERLNDYRWTGRKGYPPEAMWRAVLAKYLLRIPYARDLLAQLRASRPLRRLCGFREAVPSEATFSRFVSRLNQHQELVSQALTSVTAAIGTAIERLKEDGLLPAGAPSPGRVVAVDSTDIEAFGNHRRKTLKDPDARWGHRTPKNGGSDEFFYGYKLHATCDAYYGFPLSWEVLPANANDSPRLPPLMDQQADKFPGMPARYLLADRGYDALSNYRDLDRRGIFSVIHIRDTDKNGLYSVKGRPYCAGGQEMEYIRSDKGQGHLFRCPDAADCPLATRSPWLGRRCPQEHHETWEGDLLRRVGRLARAGRRWRRLYKRRTVIERMFGSLKRSRLLDAHCALSIARMRLHVALSLLTYAGTMLARLRAGLYAERLNMRVGWPMPAARAIA